MTPHAKPHIGIVEDNEDLRENLEFFLRAKGYIVWSAGRAESFTRQFGVARTDIALIDLTLPDEDGLDLVARLGVRDHRGLIVLTARGDLETKLHAMRVGADHFLVKPVDLRELEVTIETTWRRIQGHAPAAPERPADSPHAETATWTFDPLDLVLTSPTTGRLELSGTEATLVGVLSARPGELFRKDEILASVYPGEQISDFHRIEVVLNRLRQKARSQGIVLPIRSVFAKGLVFAAPCERTVHAKKQRSPACSADPVQRSKP